jgi:hypothetical protein
VSLRSSRSGRVAAGNALAGPVHESGWLLLVTLFVIMPIVPTGTRFQVFRLRSVELGRDKQVTELTDLKPVDDPV